MKKEKKTILVGGTFDILHLGHLQFFEYAKQQVHLSELIVVIARDATVKEQCGYYPIFSEEERQKLVKSLEIVDEAILGNPPEENDFFDILFSIKPDIIVLGHDQFFKQEKLQEWTENHGLQIKIIRAKEFDIDGISSSSQARKKVRELNE